jgi:hypothetical protein
MNINDRFFKKRESHGLSDEEYDEEATQYTHPCGSFKRETVVHFPQARRSYGSYQAPIPQVFQKIQEKPKLGENAIHDKMRSSFTDRYEEIINKIKRPLLSEDACTKDYESDSLRKETHVNQESNCCCSRPGWLW